MLRTPVALLVPALSLLASCSSFGEETTAPSVEAGIDGSPSSADGGAETGADAAAPPCPAGAFCESFERAELAGDWTVDAESGNGSTITIDDKLAVGGTRSLLATSSGRAGSCFLSRPLTSAAIFDVELSVRVDPLPGSAMVFTQVGYEGNAVVALAVNAAGIKVIEQVLGSTEAATYAESPTSAFPAQQWVRLVWHVEPGRSTLRAPGTTPPIAIDLPLKNAFTLRKTYRAGLVYTNAQAGKPRIWLDDVVVALR